MFVCVMCAEDDSSEDDSSAADAELAGTEDFTSWSSGMSFAVCHSNGPCSTDLPHVNMLNHRAEKAA